MDSSERNKLIERLEQLLVMVRRGEVVQFMSFYDAESESGIVASCNEAWARSVMMFWAGELDELAASGTSRNSRPKDERGTLQ